MRRWQRAAVVAGLLVTGLLWIAAGRTTAAPPTTTQSTTGPASVPDSFVDPETHLTVVHLSRVPNERSGVIYFTYPSFTADGATALFDVQFADKWRHLYAFDFGPMAVRPLVVDRLTQNQVVSPRSGNVYYQADNAAWVVNLRGDRPPRKIADLPARWTPGAGFTVNADETLLAGASTDVDVPPGREGQTMSQAFEKRNPNVLFTVDLRTGATRVVHRIDAWLGHVQFSPVDRGLLMYCHEGPWERVDRIWTLRVDGPDAAQPTLMYKRTEAREIVGHEFWHPNGKAIWFQQTFRSERGKSFLTGLDLASGKLTQLSVPVGGRGIHYTWSPDGTYLISDGSGPKSVTTPGPNKYLSMLVPDGDHVRVTPLCSLQRNDYAIEPNPHASPDNRWVIFTATLFGTPQAYAVRLPPRDPPRAGE